MSTFRLATSALRSTLRSASSASIVAPARLSAAPSIAIASRPSFTVKAPVLARFYAAGGGPSKEDITNRILDVLKSFEKVDPSKLSSSSAFTSDLGLDSLDAVEVVMAIEEEFSIEIPDAEADNITTVQQAIDYISKTPEAI